MLCRQQWHDACCSALKPTSGVNIVRAHGWFIASLLLSAPQPLLAAPFCVQTQALPPQCMYYDAASCSQRAQQLQGSCAVNPKEVKVSSGLGHYCLLNSSLVSMCIYT